MTESEYKEVIAKLTEQLAEAREENRRLMIVRNAKGEKIGELKREIKRLNKLLESV